jgi:hypothetical protein
MQYRVLLENFPRGVENNASFIVRGGSEEVLIELRGSFGSVFDKSEANDDSQRYFNCYFRGFYESSFRVISFVSFRMISNFCFSPGSKQHDR